MGTLLGRMNTGEIDSVRRAKTRACAKPNFVNCRDLIKDWVSLIRIHSALDYPVPLFVLMTLDNAKAKKTTTVTPRKTICKGIFKTSSAHR